LPAMRLGAPSMNIACRSRLQFDFPHSNPCRIRTFFRDKPTSGIGRDAARVSDSGDASWAIWARDAATRIIPAIKTRTKTDCRGLKCIYGPSAKTLSIAVPSRRNKKSKTDHGPDPLLRLVVQLRYEGADHGLGRPFCRAVSVLAFYERDVFGFGPQT
jgi:hypothetical protein